VARFDVCQDAADPTRFVLIEVYKTAEASAVHKGTEHYRRWRDAVADMMAEPRHSTKFHTVFPEASRWVTPD
jgi:quinol monooxygenase YgiN